MTNVIINLALMIALGIVQVSFLTTWPNPVSSLNILLSLVIFLTIIINYKKGLWFAFGAGLFTELFSGYTFGVTTLALLVTVMVTNFLFSNFFTNRSFYSLMILGFTATVIYNLVVTLLVFALDLAGVLTVAIDFRFLTQYFWQPLFNLIVLGIIFITYYFSSNKLKNIFLLPRQ